MRLVLTIFFVIAMNIHADDIFLETRHATSKRFGILEDNGQTAILYLTAIDTQKPEADVVVYSRQKPVSKVDWKEIEKTDKPPPLSADYASDTAVIKSPKPADLRLVWADDGQSFAVWFKGVPTAMIVAGQPRGYSKALKKAGPYGQPWDQKLYDQHFKKPPR